jgi:hypothetical protein
MGKYEVLRLVLRVFNVLILLFIAGTIQVLFIGLIIEKSSLQDYLSFYVSCCSLLVIIATNVFDLKRRVESRLWNAGMEVRFYRYNSVLMSV